jgi:hypothetical protein
MTNHRETIGGRGRSVSNSIRGELTMKAHLRTYWWVWLLIAAVVIAANEVVDRVGFDQSHVPADIILAVIAVAIASSCSYLVVRRRRLTT